MSKYIDHAAECIGKLPNKDCQKCMAIVRKRKQKNKRRAGQPFDVYGPIRPPQEVSHD